MAKKRRSTKKKKPRGAQQQTQEEPRENGVTTEEIDGSGDTAATSTTAETAPASVAASNIFLDVDDDDDSDHEPKRQGMWSGLETRAMKDVHCSLLLPAEMKVIPRIIDVPSGVIPARHAKGNQKYSTHGRSKKNQYPNLNYPKNYFGVRNYPVHFKGASFLQLSCFSDELPLIFPENLTVVGKCRCSSEDYKKFDLTMRSRKQCRQAGIAVNGYMNWPDVRAFVMCPVCGTSHDKCRTASKTSKDEYWLLVYPLIQYHSKGAYPIMGVRSIFRLTCIPCFESLVAGKSLDIKVKGKKESHDILTAYKRGVLRLPYITYGSNGNEPVVRLQRESAWLMYQALEFTGAWGALEKLTEKTIYEAGNNDKFVGIVSATSKDSPYAKLGQPKVNDALKCLTCKKDLTADSAFKCSDCHKAVYCSQKCQKNDRTRHRTLECTVNDSIHSNGSDGNCKRTASSTSASSISSTSAPDLNIEKIDVASALKQLTASMTKPPPAEICRMCNEGLEDDDENFLICYCCGEIIMCETCSWRAENDDARLAIIRYCYDCGQRASETSLYPGILIENMLHKYPKGRHVKMARLMLAQCRMNDPELTGVPKDPIQAREDYLQLANEDNYPLASYAVATMYYPINDSIYAGPLAHLNRNCTNPFPRDAALAKQYYEKALKQNFRSAMVDVGIYLINGNKPYSTVDKYRSAQLFRRAAERNDPRGMTQLAQMLICAEGIPRNTREGLAYYRTVANKFNRSHAQFMLAHYAQIGVISKEEGLEMEEKLRLKNWAPSDEYTALLPPCKTPPFEMMRLKNLLRVLIHKELGAAASAARKV